MMVEDRLLIWKCKCGSKAAFQRIYEKYESDLRTLADSLLKDKMDAEDVVQDVFVSLLQAVEKFSLRSNLKGYLMTCVANKSRDYFRKRQKQQNVAVNKAEQMISDTNEPVQLVVHSKDVRKLSYAIKQLSYEQREAIVLRLHGEMKFKTIAGLQKVSIKTAHSRYRHGIDRLKSILDGEMGA
jgi:RNA polymerase sigma-70 factor (ECF subfamily)